MPLSTDRRDHMKQGPKGQNNMAKRDIARIQKILVDVFYHVRQVTARVTKLVRVGIFWDPILEKGRSAMVPFKWSMIVCCRLFIKWPLRYSNDSAAIYHQMSPTLKSTGGGLLWAKCAEEGLHRCKPNKSLPSIRKHLKYFKLYT